MCRRGVGVIAVFLIGMGCGGEQAVRARPDAGGGGTSTGAGGIGGTGTTGGAGTTGAAGTIDTAGTAGTGGAIATGGSTGTAGTTGAAGSAGTTGTAGTNGRGGTTGSGGAGIGNLPCPVVIDGSIDATDQAQIGRESRINAPAACGLPKPFPGDGADPVMSGNPHLADVYRFVNTTAATSCFDFTLTYDATVPQRYMTAYTTYDPANIGAAYLGDVGSQLVSPQPMGITVPAGSSIDVVVFAIDVGVGGVGPYTLSCTASTVSGAGGTGGAGGAGAGGAAGGAGGAGGTGSAALAAPRPRR